MALLSGTAELQCGHCEYTFHIDASDLDIAQVSTDERQMGPEIFYEGRAELNCPQCGGYIQVINEASEYPIGAPNYSDTHIEGARIIQDFKELDVSEQDEIYSLEEESKLYQSEEKNIITNLHSGVSDLILQISKAPSLLYQIKPRQFEELIAHILSQHGFTVELTKQTRDGGKDIIAIKSELGIKSKYIIECKRYAASNPVGVGLVRALFATQTLEGANKSVLATISRFTPAAHSFAKATNNIEWSMDLKDFNDIYEWIKSTATAYKSLKGTS